MRLMIGIVVGWLAFTPELQAQPDWAAVKLLAPGTRVRVNNVAGTLELANDAAIVLSGQAIPKKQVRRVEVIGLKGNRAKLAGIGLAVGGVGGAIAMKANGGNAFGMFWVGSIYGGTGAAVGALTGHSSTHRVIYER
jgi:hypothetical protein